MKACRRASVIVLVAALTTQVACTIRTTQRVRLTALRPEERGAIGPLRVAGVTYRNGSTVMFDSLLRAAPETLYAMEADGEHQIPRRLIAQLWVRRAGEMPVAARSSDPARAVALAPLKQRIVGVVTTAGAVVEFDGASPVSAPGDTLFATARGAPYRVALADVDWMRVRRTDAGLSVLATTGLVLVAIPAVAVGLLALACSGGSGGLFC